MKSLIFLVVILLNCSLALAAVTYTTSSAMPPNQYEGVISMINLRTNSILIITGYPAIAMAESLMRAKVPATKTVFGSTQYKGTHFTCQKSADFVDSYGAHKGYTCSMNLDSDSGNLSPAEVF